MSIPKFKIEYGTEVMNKSLMELGLRKAFVSSTIENSFSIMGPGAGAHIEQVLHKALIEVDETGTVATA